MHETVVLGCARGLISGAYHEFVAGPSFQFHALDFRCNKGGEGKDGCQPGGDDCKPQPRRKSRSAARTFAQLQKSIECDGHYAVLVGPSPVGHELTLDQVLVRALYGPEPNGKQTQL